MPRREIGKQDVVEQGQKAETQPRIQENRSQTIHEKVQKYAGYVEIKKQSQCYEIHLPNSPYNS